jgi:hypothetical protein
MARFPSLLSGAAALAVLLRGAVIFAADGTCFVDSVAGLPSNDGQTEDTPWQSPAQITSACTTVKFKRGSEFAVAQGAYAVDLMTLRNLKTLTNYGDPTLPLPRFVKQRQVSSGGMLVAYMGGITIDGLYLSGSQSDAMMSNLGDGICVMLGANSALINSEVTLCDIGIMTIGDNVRVLNNYVHDLFISVDGEPGIDPNAVGGAEGIFVNSSHVEVAYNRFINCTIPAQWVSGTSKRCDGGATEVTVGYAGEVTDVEIHHNLSYNSCGFFEVSSMFQPAEDTGPYVKGRFTDSVFHNNVMIDSGWIALLQINNTKLSNVRWENNTIVHHDLGTDTDGTDLNDFASSRIIAIPFNSTSSGVTGGGEISEGDIFWTNNLWYFDPAVPPLPIESDEFLKNVVQTNNLILTSDPGFVNLAATTDPGAFDLLPGSQAIDAGADLAEITSDFLDRPAPFGAALDVGAFEYQGQAPAGGASSTGGAPATGGDGDAGGTATGGTLALGGAGAALPDTGGTPDTPAAGGAGGAGAALPDTGGTPDTPAAGGGGAGLDCSGTLTLCGDLCVDLTSDPGHCGSCEGACAAELVCSASVCTSGCATGTTLCGQSCVDMTTDVLHCGTCDTRCLDGQRCTGSLCVGEPTGGDPTVPVPSTPQVASGAEPAKDEGGCGCVVAGSSAGGREAWLGSLISLVALLQRRRRDGLRRGA